MIRSGNTYPELHNAILLCCIIFLIPFSSARTEDRVIPGTYPYWPKYKKTPLGNVRPQRWRDREDIIKGWDWSLPPSVKPSPRSLIAVDRHMGYRKEIKKQEYHFPVNAVTLHWIHWKQVEPKEGVYKWDELKKRILEAAKGGTGSVVRLLTCCRARTDAGEGGGHTPDWLKKYKINTLTYKDHKTIRHRKTINYDPADPVFHKHYLRLIRSFKKSSIPRMKELKAAYVGYASPTLGDEGIGPHKEIDPLHVKERLDAWADAFKHMEYKIFMGAPSPYGLSLGFGVRRGFVEKYLYHIPSEAIGQEVDCNGYLMVDESALVIKKNCFNGEVNEEYDEAWATKQREFRFGKTLDSFSYRYFTSNLRVLQMRCTYVHTTCNLVPGLMPFLSLELARTVKDTPDIWCYLRESYMNQKVYKRKDTKGRKFSQDEEKNGIPVKNFERWLYQRDRDGHRTRPVLKISQPPNMSQVQKDRYYDFIARQGKSIGFGVDDRFLLNGPHHVAVKVSYFDTGKGELSLLYHGRSGKKKRSILLKNTGSLNTATFFIEDGFFPAKGMEHDIFIKGDPAAVVSFVRIIKL